MVARALCRLLLVLLLAGLATLSAPAPGHAQGQAEQAAIDFTQWEREAWVAEALLEDGGVSDERLLELRTRIVRWRESFQTAQTPNTARLTMLNGQLEALGPPPAEGATEPPEIAARRAELSAAISQEQAPALRAAEAFGRADSIVQQIDLQLRERKANTLAHVSPSPLRPSSWAEAVGEAGAWLSGALSDTHRNARALPRDSLHTRLPLAAVLMVLAGLALTVGRRWVQTLPEKLWARATRNAREAVAFVTSLLQIVLPYVGVRLAVAAIDTSGLVGPYLRPLLVALPGAALSYFTGRWLVVNLFPADPAAPARLRLTEAGTRRMRRYGTGLAVMLALFVLTTPAILPLGGLGVLGLPAPTVPQPFGEAAAAVWHLLMLTVAGVLLFRMGGVLQDNLAARQGEPVAYRYRIAATFGTVSRAVAVLAPLLAMLGYVSAANSLLWPWLETLGLVGLVMLLQKFIDDLWVLIKGSEEGARNALAPVLIGFALMLLSLPFLALIWGARTSDLGEVWLQLRAGVTVGGITISPSAMLTFAFVFGVVYILTRAVQAAFSSSILPKTKLDSGAQNAVVSGLGYVGIFLAGMMAISSAGLDLSNLALVAGALSVGIGFGLQTVVSNFVSGIILLIERPVAVGDWIQVGTEQGIVQRISVRSTVIQTFDRADVIIPNSDLISGTVTNLTLQSLQGRVVIPVTVGFDSDTRAVADLLVTIAEEQPLVLVNPAPSVVFSGFGSNGLEFQLRAVLSDIIQGMMVSTEIRHQIVERFRAAGILIPGSTHAVRVLGADGAAAAGAAATAAAAAAAQAEEEASS